MKNILRFTLIVSLFVVSVCATVSASPQKAKVPDGWLNGGASFEPALELQRELKVPLVVYFYVDWCPYCHALEREYFPAASVSEYLRSVIKVRINPELSRADRGVANAFGVGGYPSFFVIGAPNMPPIKLSPFRRDRNLTPAEFTKQCREVGRLAAAAAGITPPPSAPQKSAPAASRASNTAQAFEAAATPTAPASTALTTADAVLTKYTQVAGSAQGRVTTRVIKGRVDVPGLSFGGRFEFYYSKSANKSLTVMSVEPLGVVKQGFDGQSVWTAADKSAQNTNLPAVVALAATDFYREVKLSDLYPRTKLLGKNKEGDREVYVVEAAPRAGAAERLSFDALSGLLVQRDFTRQTSRGPVDSEIYFSDWRTVDGFRIPFGMTQLIGNLTFVITLDEIKHNVAIDDTVFQRPIR